MIELDTARIPKLDRLKNPPTHAHLGSLSSSYLPHAATPVNEVIANYHYGNLTADGAFVPDPEFGTLAVVIRPGQLRSAIDADKHASILETLFTAEGDVRRGDVDAIAAEHHPELYGKAV